MPDPVVVGHRLAVAILKMSRHLRSAGMPAGCSPGLGLLLFFLFGLGILYYQSELNKVVNLSPSAPEGSRVPLYA
jgi:hypothetical protein